MKTNIPARSGKAIQVREGAIIKVINSQGGQVVDTWALVADDPEQYMSMAHTRALIRRLKLHPGDVLLSNYRDPLLTVMEDFSPGIHDFLMPPCDSERYAQLGVHDHDNCRDNFHEAIADLGIHLSHTPAPLNLFQNSSIGSDLTISFHESPAQPGDNIIFRAERDLVLAFSCCPMDIMTINARQPVDVDVEVIPPDAQS